ncbi:hypothetical protein MMPV_008654 [Pyropia vietnamensis]
MAISTAPPTSPLPLPLPFPPLLPLPDSLFLLTCLVALLITTVLLRSASAAASATYRGLSPSRQYDWVQRALNLTVNGALFAPAHAYVLWVDPAVAADPLRGYSAAAHATFLATSAYMVVDGVLYAAHPAGVEWVWVAHHAATAGGLGWLTARGHVGAAAASALLASNAAYVASEARWFGTTVTAARQRRAGGGEAGRGGGTRHDVLRLWASRAADVAVVVAVATSSFGVPAVYVGLLAAAAEPGTGCDLLRQYYIDQVVRAMT